MPARIQRLLCRKLNLSNPEVLQLFAEGRVLLNGSRAIPNQTVHRTDELRVNGTIIQEAARFSYVAMYKPRGIECTSNTTIADNLYNVLPHEYKELYTVGRLDKDTEGLLLLTNDAAFYDAIADSDNRCEKEYEVSVAQELNEAQLEVMRAGMKILGQQTRPCTVTLIKPHCFRITLTQGLNRQIRRMCYKLGLDILSLKRIRIAGIHLAPLSIEHKYRLLDEREVKGIMGKQKE